MLEGSLSAGSFWRPEYLSDSAWLTHAPFAFWLVGALRPRTLVELGTHTGFSYFAFCQAVKALGTGTNCYAVDTWKGDEHAGFYDEEIFLNVETHNARYAEFSKLVRSSFDDAAPAFDRSSIDLLHIDGRHFYKDVRHDFEVWRPKLSDRAIVLFHDTDVRGRGFGVFKLWAELSGEFSAFQFLHGYGLGVLGYGTDLPAPLKRLFEASPSDVAAIRHAYQRLGHCVLLEAEKEIERLRGEPKKPEAAPPAAAKTVASKKKLRAAEGLVDRLEEVIADQDKALRDLASQLADLKADKERLRRKLGRARKAMRLLEQVVEAMRSSKSWRVTRPLRALAARSPFRRGSGAQAARRSDDGSSDPP